jgi:hypothetical protein
MNNRSVIKNILHSALLVFLFLCFGRIIEAQPVLPPRSITVNSTQALHFGTFCLENTGSSGGTVSVDWQGNRTSTGQVYLLPTAPIHQAAIFEISLCQGRSVVISYPQTTILTGSNGGTMTLYIGPTEKGESGSTFQVNGDCNFITQLRVGGKLIVGSNSANPGGTYTGSFSIIFNQQ